MGNSKKPKTVAIVGAGFAGLVAARELETVGIKTEIFEARDRIGGRAWTEDRMGHTLELGATWVHWMQPFIWTEIKRYKQGIYPSPVAEQALWITGGELREGSEAELDAKLERPQAAIFEGSREFFPYPHDPLYVLESGDEELIERFKAKDNAKVLDVLREGDFTQEEIDLADAYWSAGYIGYTDTASPLMAMHWASLSDHRLGLLDEQTLRFKLTNGMKGIYEGIREDVEGDIHLNSPVTKIVHGDDSVELTLGDDSTFTADAVIVTVPLGAMKTIQFDPPLSQERTDLVEEGFNSTGVKAWIKVDGHHSVLAYAPTGSPLALIRSEYFLDDGTTILVGFGSDHNRLDLNDIEAVQEVVSQWRPDLKVVDATGHDWVADPWSGQAWATLKSGQFINGWSLFRGSDTRLRFAGADWAEGWNGVVVDGAIETGITTARDLIDEFRAEGN